MAEEPEPIGASAEAENGGQQKAAVPWIPLVLVLLFIPIITVVLVEFVVVPKLKSSFQEGGGGGGATVEEKADGGGGHGGGADSGSGYPGATVEFEDMISNLSGTMGTRFLKVSFQVVSEDAQLGQLIKMREPQVRDAIISTLSSQTIQELEAPGGRNALRVALIGAINEAIELNLVEELYFTEFIIQ